MSYNDADIESFTITSRNEINFYLNQLINDQEPLTANFDEGRETLLTMALHLDESKGQLFFDWGGSETSNQRLLRAGSATFVASPQGVRNLFQVGGLRSATYQGRPAFVGNLPAKYVRLQRREYFRLTLPLTQRIPCRLDLPLPAGAAELTGVVVDIGVGGVGIEIKGVIAIEQGQILQRATLDLGKFGLIRPDLAVRFVGQTTRGNDTYTRLGCSFARLGRGEDVTIQRYITQIQRDERARLG